MIDVHCHLNFHKFESDYEQVIKDAQEAGVSTIVNTGTSIPSSRQAVDLARKFKNLYAIVGIHPHHADKSDVKFEGELHPDWLGKLEELAKQPKVIGIGEIGMDFWNYRTNGIVPKDLQEDAFRKQIELSIRLGLPLQIHTRLAWNDTLSILSDYKDKLLDPPGMFHCFSGNIEFTRKVLNAGFYLGFDGNITYKGIPPGEDTELSKLVEYAPLDRILTETDSPFLTPQTLRGTRNEPKNVIIVAEHIAFLKNIQVSEVEKAVHENFKTIFGEQI
ncbi:MAG: TatD family hydrolase [Candidatus Levyibacteriota bacterium]